MAKPEEKQELAPFVKTVLERCDRESREHRERWEREADAKGLQGQDRYRYVKEQFKQWWRANEEMEKREAQERDITHARPLPTSMSED